MVSRIEIKQSGWKIKFLLKVTELLLSMQFFKPLEGYVIKYFYKGVGVKGQWTWIKMQLSINDNNFSQECPVVILFGKKGMKLEANIFMYSLGLKVKGQWTLANIFGELEMERYTFGNF